MSEGISPEYRALLRAVAERLGGASCGPEHARLARLVERVHDRLARPPRIGVFGEINCGKSSLANLLIGETVVPTSVVANSRFPIRFHYAGKPTLAAVFADGQRYVVHWSQIDGLAKLPVARIDVGLPVERLRLFEVVDTPGTGAAAQKADRIEARAPLVHLRIWCTVAARAWKESERKAWSRLAGARRPSGMLVVTQTDLLAHKADITKVLGRLQHETAGQFAEIIPLAIPDALKSSTVDGAASTQALWSDSGGARLEAAIARRLADIAERRVAAARHALRRAFLRGGPSASEALLEGLTRGHDGTGAASRDRPMISRLERLGPDGPFQRLGERHEARLDHRGIAAAPALED